MPVCLFLDHSSRQAAEFFNIITGCAGQMRMNYFVIFVLSELLRLLLVYSVLILVMDRRKVKFMDGKLILLGKLL